MKKPENKIKVPKLCGAGCHNRAVAWFEISESRIVSFCGEHLTSDNFEFVLKIKK